MPKRRPKTPQLKDLKEDPENPRAITEKSLSGLKTALEEYGDLSGITWNRRTGLLVSGHQRMRALGEEHGKKLKIAGGFVITPDGERFRVRVVDWPEDKARAANLTANNHLVGGEFTAAVVPMLDKIEIDFPDLAGELRLPELSVDFGAFNIEGVEAPELSGEDRAPFQQMTFTLHDKQVQTVKSAMEAAKQKGPFVKTGNENSNGNALARLAEAYLGKS